MIVSYNKYERIDKPTAGASLFYYEMSKLLEQDSCENIKAVPHNFQRLVQDKEKIKGFGEEDVVLSNIGPYSWFYYYLREKNNCRFRIIHDVQTALFADHILQEMLCSRYMREGDIVMFLSEYQRQLYIKLFPEHLNKRNTIVCNPLLNFLPKINNRYDGKEMVIGWIGRMFDAKNFDQALNIFIGLSKETHESVKFIAAGIAEPKYEERKVHKYLEEKGINPSNYLHSGGGQFINRQEIGRILGKINLLLFPSIGNMESLGRVVIEANNAGIPVIAANHGAMPEILQKSSLVNVSYSREEISLNYPSSLGKIDEEEAIKKCKHYKKLDIGDNSSYKNHDKIFFEILYGNQTSKITYLEKNVRDFIKNVQINLNGDFSLNSVSLIKKAVSFMQECCKTSQLDIGETSHRLRERLNFNPSLFIK